MSSTGDLLGTAVSSLTTAQQALSVTGHNIANVNTPGYSRQRVDLITKPPFASGAGFIGAGVSIAGIRRLYDNFLGSQVVNRSAISAQYETLDTYTRHLSELMTDSLTSLAGPLQEFFDSVQDVSNDPTSGPARHLMLSHGELMADRFHTVSQQMRDLRQNSDRQLQSVVNDINSLSASIANINGDISVALGLSGGQPPNDLLDQRDSLIKKLSEYVSVSTIEQDGGTVNVFIGNGQNLVIGKTSIQLGITSSEYDPEQLQVGYISGGNTIDISQHLTGGTIGGIFQFRSNVLDEIQNTVGRLAVGLGKSFNDQHQLGMDQNDQLGGLFFNQVDLSAPQVLASRLNTGTADISVSITELGQLTTSDYLLDRTGSSYTLRRLSDDSTTTLSTFPGAAQTIDGITLSLDPATTIADGDSFLIRPTRSAAQNIAVVISSPEEIAAASPIRSEATNGNSGTGKISAGMVVDTTNAAFATGGALTPPLLIQFINSTSYAIYDNTIPAVPVLLETGIPYNPATGGAVFPTPGALDYGYRVDITGSPSAGDTFSVEYNSGGQGDNRNGLALFDLHKSGTFDSSTLSFSDAFSQMVGEIGIQSRQASINYEAQHTLLRQAEEALDSVAGVNLDEEAANLLRFQQAYQASAQVISAVQSMFQTLISVARG